MPVRQNILIFKLLSHFVTVVDYKQLKGAAEFLGLKQSNLSKEMRDLEELVGKKLMFRTSHGTEITADGQRLYGMATDCIERVALLIDDYKCGETHNSITLRAPSATLRSFYYYLDDFQHKHPNITCNFISDEILNNSMMKDVDVCITYCRDNWMDTEVICSGDMKFALATTQKYIDKCGLPKNTNDLYENHHLLVCNEYYRFNPDTAKRYGKMKHLDYKASNFDQLLTLLNEKYLITCIPSYMLRFSPNLVQIELPDWQFSQPIKIVSLKEKIKLPHVFGMCELVANGYKKVALSGGLDNFYINPKFEVVEMKE